MRLSVDLKRIVLFLESLVILFCFISIPIKAQTAEEYLLAAQRAFSEEKHEFALESIKKAIYLNPGDLEYKYLLALILIGQEKYKEGMDFLNALILADEARFAKAYFDLAGVYHKQRRYDEAIAALEKAEKVDRERALLLQGFIYLDSGQLDRAIEKLNEVRQHSRFKPDACYNLGIAYQRKRDYKKASFFAQEALDIASEPGITQNARLLLDSIKGEMRLRKRFWLIGTSTGQYDDNVILQPLEQAGLQKIGIPPSDQSDYVTIMTIKGGYKPVLGRNWELALGGSYLQYFYSKLTRNNLSAFMPEARLSFSFSPLFFKCSYSYGRFIVDGKPYAQVHSISPFISLIEGPYTRSELMFQTDMRRYLDGITPDADHYMIAFWQSFMISKLGEARLGYKLEIEDNKEDKGDFISHEIILGASIPFVLKSYLNISYSYLMRNFKFTEVISLTQKRKDQAHLIYVFLNKRFGRYIELNLSYIYTLNDSNIGFPIPDFVDFDPYYWRKNIVSLSLSLFF